MYLDENEVPHPDQRVLAGVNQAFYYDGLVYSEAILDLFGNPVTFSPNPEDADGDEDLTSLLADFGL